VAGGSDGEGRSSGGNQGRTAIEAEWASAPLLASQIMSSADASVAPTRAAATIPSADASVEWAARAAAAAATAAAAARASLRDLTLAAGPFLRFAGGIKQKSK
jgi:hypothetical protein